MTRLLALLITLLAAAAAPAQRIIDRPLDEAIEDVHALSTSLRLVEQGLDRGNGFDRVYRVPGETGRLMRVQGGLFAVFPESVYKRDKKGKVFPQIPGGTIFYLGHLPEPDNEMTPPPSRGRIVTRIDALRAGPVPATRVTSARPTGTGHVLRRVPSTYEAAPIVADPVYRAERIRSLMRRAAGNAIR